MTTTRDEVLAPCPFCTGTDIRFDAHPNGRSPTGYVWSMCCYQCGATFPNRYKKDLLVENWNRRDTRSSPIQGREAVTHMTVHGIDEAFSEFRKTLTVMDPKADHQSFAQGYVAGWNAKETQLIPETCSDCGIREPCDEDCPNHIEPEMPPPAGNSGREEIKAAIRKFCQSLGAGSVQMSHGIERIYYAGISLDALSVAVELALSTGAPGGGAVENTDAYRDTVRKVAAVREGLIASQAAEIKALAARITHLTTALSAAGGYLRNADIDLATGARKATAQRTIQGGLKMVEAALVLPDTTLPRAQEG